MKWKKQQQHKRKKKESNKNPKIYTPPYTWNLNFTGFLYSKVIAKYTCKKTCIHFKYLCEKRVWLWQWIEYKVQLSEDIDKNDAIRMCSLFCSSNRNLFIFFLFAFAHRNHKSNLNWCCCCCCLLIFFLIITYIAYK